MEKKLLHLQQRRDITLNGGGEKRIQEQHQKGKGTARERLALFLDEGSFVELGTFVQTGLTDASSLDIKNPGEGVVTGYGTVNGRQVFVFAQEFTVAGGSLSEAHAAKICHVLDLASKSGDPVVGINDSAPVYRKGLCFKWLWLYLSRNTIYSGSNPQISVIMGPSAGARYSPAYRFLDMVSAPVICLLPVPRLSGADR